ncbi:MAG: hypothetical protein E7138_05635 [Rikenellaceae bacterium]|nr:hypothetical protein [Rikenellaceae bacterium]
MEFNDYQAQAMTTCTESSNNFNYMMLNLVGEVGEFASKIAKSIRKSEATIDKNDIFVKGEWFRSSEKDLKAEAGDILWQLSGLCSVMGWSLEDVAKANLAKLADRKNRGVIIGNGDKR